MHHDTQLHNTQSQNASHGHHHGHHHHPDGPHGHGGGRHSRGGGPFGGGPFAGVAFEGGRGGVPRDRARRGEARYVLLDALRDGPKHGYEIIKALEEKSSGQYVPSPGTVYPTMQYLEDQGLVRADQAAERRVYHLTPEGQTELDAHADDLADFWQRFSGPTGADTARPEMGFLRDALEDLGRTLGRGLKDTDDPAKIKCLRQAVEQCQNTVREILSDTASAAADTAPPASGAQ